MSGRTAGRRRGRYPLGFSDRKSPSRGTDRAPRVRLRPCLTAAWYHGTIAVRRSRREGHGQMTKVLYSLGRFSVRRRYVVLGVWLVIAVALVVVSHQMGDTTNNNLSLPGTGSQRAMNAMAKPFPDQSNGSRSAQVVSATPPSSFALPWGLV